MLNRLFPINNKWLLHGLPQRLRQLHQHYLVLKLPSYQHVLQQDNYFMQSLPTRLQHLLKHHLLPELPPQLLLQSALGWNLLIMPHLKLPQLHLPQLVLNLCPWLCKCRRPLPFMLQFSPGMPELHNRRVRSQHQLHLLH